MRVLQVHTRYRLRGGEDHVVERERALLRGAGHEVEAFEAQNAETAVGSARQLSAAAWNPSAARALERSIREFRPDTVHLHNTWYALSPSVAVRARRLGVPVVMTLHNYRLTCVNGLLFRDGSVCEDCVGHLPWRGVAHRCYRDSAAASAIAATQTAIHRGARTWPRSVDLFLALSEFASARHATAGIPRERIAIKYNFVDDPGPRLRAPSESDEVIFVGRDSPEKGLAGLLEYWREASPPGLRLTVIGPIEAGQSPPGAPVEFAGELDREEVMRRMLGARALVVPSRCPEGPSLAVFEALAAGLPLVGSAVGGIEELLTGLAGSYCVAVDDRPGWVGALRALADDAVADRGGEQARDVYEERFSPERALGALLECYELASKRHANAEAAPLPSRR